MNKPSQPKTATESEKERRAAERFSDSFIGHAEKPSADIDTATKREERDTLRRHAGEDMSSS